MSHVFSINKSTNRGKFALTFITIFFIGWLSFSWYVYSNQILLISIEGPIEDFQSTVLALYQGKLNNNVKAVVLYLNTPGGLASACMEISLYVKDLAKDKPVVAIMGAQATSGGYYIASFARYIFAHENSYTGGIGVIATWTDLSEYYQQQGIKIWVWKTGYEKDFGAEWRSPTEAENASISANVNSIFNILITDIKNNRPNLSSESIEAIIAGGVFTGGMAVQMGLVDNIGNIIDAIGAAASMAGLWKFIMVSSDMNEMEKFFRALL